VTGRAVLLQPLRTGDPRLFVSIVVHIIGFALSVRDFWRRYYLHIPKGLLDTLLTRLYLGHH